MPDTPYLEELSRSLEFRWRARRFLGVLATTSTVSVAVSLGLGLASILFDAELPLPQLILMVNGAAVVAALLFAAVKRRAPESLLADADAVYKTREVMTSAFEFAHETDVRASTDETSFRTLVIGEGEQRAEETDPAAVYPLPLPRRFSITAALVAVLAVFFLLDASGWFERPTVQLSEQGLLLEDAGRRLADRRDNEELQELADEIRRLGEQLREGELEADEARRQIEQLGERVEEQVRNLERFGEFATNQDVEIPEEIEESVRSALRRGMTEGEVLDFFMSMNAEGETLPDTLRALEEASGDRPPDANLDLDDDRVRELLDQLNLNPESTEGAGTAEELENIQRSLQQAGIDVQELSPGDDERIGEQPGPPGESLRGGPSGDEQESGPGEDLAGEGESGETGGDEPVGDAMNDTFRRIEEASPIFRQIEGVIGEGTIRDVIIRELPSEAISRLDEREREVAFERVIEEAVAREDTPPELQSLVRNYFLRITLGKEEGAEDEQQSVQ